VDWSGRETSSTLTLSSLLRKEEGKILPCSQFIPWWCFFLASVLFFTQSIRKEASIVLKASPEMIIQRLVAGRHELIPMSYIDKIRGIRGVSSVKRPALGVLLRPDRRCKTDTVDRSPKMAQTQHWADYYWRRQSQATRLVFEGDMMEFRTYDGGPY